MILHNSATAFVIQDKNQKPYRIDWLRGDHGWSLWLCDERGWRIGYAHTTFRNGGLFLGDIRLRNDVPAPASWLRRALAARGIGKIPLMDYRNRGLGTALLARLEILARQEGFSAITGCIVESDITRWPDLPAWYRRQGYSVIEKEPNSSDIGRLRIEKPLL
ncbi:MAG TPA: GNAT family N-acetyltransferase [Rariglobus sp.]|jgi:hypothetical protein|nr:GNAT family N-acetyltransferase [Rariglobus sp.]